MAWLNCYDNPETYPDVPSTYHGWMHLSFRRGFFSYELVAKQVPLIVFWDGTEDDLGEQLWSFVEQYCKDHGHFSTPKYRGGDGDYIATICLDFVEQQPRTAIPDVFLKALK